MSQHDDKLAVTWGRKILSEPKRGSKGEPRDPLTVRNIARVLQEIYKFARTSGYFPQDRRLPTEAEEFKAEMSGALKEKAKLGLLSRVACPVETARAGRKQRRRPAAPTHRHQRLLLHGRSSGRAPRASRERLS